MNEPTLSIDDLDFTSDCNVPRDIELKHPDGQPVGLTLQILGAEAEKVSKFILKRTNELRQRAATKMKAGKIDQVESVEDDINFSIDSCVVRTVGWKGVKEPFSAELARRLFAKNSHFRAQVIEESNNAANFMKR